MKNLVMTDKFGFVYVYKVDDLCLVWSTDLEKGARLFQIIKICIRHVMHQKNLSGPMIHFIVL